MSKEKLQAFVEAVSRSEQLQKRLAEIQLEAARLTAEKIAKLSESTGTPFTAEEYLKSVAESSDEMSAEQLQSVAGGASADPNQILDSIYIFLKACTGQTHVTALQGDECLPKPAP